MNSEIEHIICCTEHFLSLEEKDVRDELKLICKEAGTQDCTLFLSNGGIEYTLNYIIKDIYLTNKPIDNDVRVKINIFNIVIHTDIKYTINYNIFELKRRYNQETYKYAKEECKEKIEELKVKIRQAVKKFYNY